MRLVDIPKYFSLLNMNSPWLVILLGLKLKNGLTYLQTKFNFIFSTQLRAKASFLKKEGVKTNKFIL